MAEKTESISLPKMLREECVKFKELMIAVIDAQIAQDGSDQAEKFFILYEFDRDQLETIKRFLNSFY